MTSSTQRPDQPGKGRCGLRSQHPAILAELAAQDLLVLHAAASTMQEYKWLPPRRTGARWLGRSAAAPLGRLEPAPP